MPDVVSLDDLTERPHATLFPDVEPRTVRLSLPAGESVAEHSHPGRDVVIHVRSGELDLTLDGETDRLEPGDVARFDGERRVQPTARADVEALVVLAPRPD